MTLLVTIFLVLINIHNTIQTNSPKVDTISHHVTQCHGRTTHKLSVNNKMFSLLSQYKCFKAEGLTAIECWVIACIIFVFGALLEYTVILLQLKLKKVRQGSKHQNGYFLGSRNGGGASTSSGAGEPGAAECTDLIMPRNTRATSRKKSSAQGGHQHNGHPSAAIMSLTCTRLIDIRPGSCNFNCNTPTTFSAMFSFKVEIDLIVFPGLT